MSIAYAVVQEQKKMLGNLDRWIEKAVAHAATRSFDPVIFLSARLAPDQYTLVRQIQSACDTAKFTAARVTAKDPPKHPDTEQTIDEARARIASVTKYLDTFSPSDFEGAEARLVKLSFAPGKAMVGADYLFEMQIPNFFFHVTTAYAILRHNGVNLGKMDYIGSVATRDV
jgi:hypothetical protein